MELKLIVLRTGKMKPLVDFFGLLGLEFKYHQHGNSPYHYSTPIGNVVFEIYPLKKGQMEADSGIRLGIGIDNFDATLAKLAESGIFIESAPQQTEFGYVAVVVDPDGRKIELYKK